MIVYLYVCHAAITSPFAPQTITTMPLIAILPLFSGKKIRFFFSVVLQKMNRNQYDDCCSGCWLVGKREREREREKKKIIH